MQTVIFKKHGYYVYLTLLFSLFFISSPLSFSQTNYIMSIDNGRYINNNTYEFDIYIKSSGVDFELTSYQC
ncbi:MAG TPA: hypothetical protein VMT35_09440, partial [Ignavibacteriaceae bacterium]|nr:hypothetical protein [Ignavibacteriaceae bacterium]